MADGIQTSDLDEESNDPRKRISAASAVVPGRNLGSDAADQAQIIEERIVGTVKKIPPILPQIPAAPKMETAVPVIQTAVPPVAQSLPVEAAAFEKPVTTLPVQKAESPEAPAAAPSLPHIPQSPLPPASQITVPTPSLQDVPPLMKTVPTPKMPVHNAAPMGPRVPEPDPEATLSDREIEAKHAAALPEIERSGDMNRDIAQILKAVKLPERRDAKTAGETKSRIPDMVPGMVSMPSSLEEFHEQQRSAAPHTESETEKKRDIVSPMRTLREDLKDVVREKKISLVRAVALEQEKKQGNEKVLVAETASRQQRSRRIKGVIFTIIVLFFLGLAAIFGVFLFAQQSSPTPTAADTSLLFAETSVTLPLAKLSSADVKNLIAQARGNNAGTLGSITRVIPLISYIDTNGAEAKREATFAEFMQALGAHPPDELVRAVSNDFFFGLHTVDKNAPLFVIHVSSYDHAFSGMLSWESTINAELSPAFTSVPALMLGQDGLPTQRAFADAVMRNYDVRTLKDDSGNVELYYSFPTRNILIIAESPYSFPEILSRLQAGRKL